MNPLHTKFTHRSLINSPTPIPKQRGMATLLIVLLVGVGLVSISVGAMHAIRSTQERQNAAHAQVNAQSGAWAAAEAMRQYLLTLDATQVAALPLNTEWTLSGYTGFEPKVRFTAVTPYAPNNSYRVNTRITVIANTAQASSVLELVYEVSPATGSVTSPKPSIIHYKGDINFSGGIIIDRDPGDTTPYAINVDGNVTNAGVDIRGVDVLRSTKSIDIQGGTNFFKEVYSNCDVRFSGGSLPRKVNATRHISLSNTTNQGNTATICDNEEIRANGSVLLGASACGYTNVYALAGKGDFSFCEDKTTPAPGLNKVLNGEYGNKFGVTEQFGANAINPTDANIAGGVYLRTTRTQVVKSNNDIILDDSNTAKELHAVNNINFLKNGDTVSGFAKYGNALNFTIVNNRARIFPPDTNKNIKAEGAYNLALDKAIEVSIPIQSFDVATLKQHANYVFWRDASGDLRIDVKNIKANGSAINLVGGYLGRADWVCASKPSPTVVPTDCLFQVANKGYNSATEGSISWSGNKWSFNNHPNATMAPGIAYFEGDLSIPSGIYYNTFLVTGNITNSGATYVYAPNYAGFDGRQEKDGTAKRYSPEGICVNSKFPNVIPTQLCTTATTYDFSAAAGIGNYAFMAGTCCDGAGVYQGGDIETGASSLTYGAIKAGNIFKSGGGTIIRGYVSAAGQQNQTSNHSLGGSTTFDLKDLPPGYNPAGGPSTSGTTTPGAASSAKILWSRYL